MRALLKGRLSEESIACNLECYQERKFGIQAPTPATNLHSTTAAALFRSRTNETLHGFAVLVVQPTAGSHDEGCFWSVFPS